MTDLTPVSKFEVKVECGCPRGPYRCTGKFLMFAATQQSLGQKTFASLPAMRRFNVNTLQFDEDYWNSDNDDDEDTLELVRPVHNHICTTCMQGMTILDVKIPASTWILVAEVPKEHNVSKDSLRRFPNTITYSGGVQFKMAWCSFLKDGTNFVSFHRLNSHWYCNDLERNPKLARVPDNYNFSGVVLKRIFYYRVTIPEPNHPADKSPHRCLELANATDDVEGIWAVAAGLFIVFLLVLVLTVIFI